MKGERRVSAGIQITIDTQDAADAPERPFTLTVITGKIISPAPLGALLGFDREESA